jgi:predicted glycogen debranching enzyme
MMNEIVRGIDWPARNLTENEFAPTHEWIVTNGLGGYATGTVTGVLTRRFHGVLIAALASPFGRTMMLNNLVEAVRLAGGQTVVLGSEERADTGVHLNGAIHLAEFRLEYGLPVWRYEIQDAVIEKRLMLPHLQNTTLVSYSLLSGGPVRLDLRPAIHFRPHEGRVGAEYKEPYTLTAVEDRFELCERNSQLPPLKMMLRGESSAFTFRGEMISALIYHLEQRRGYDYRGDLWSPGYYSVELTNDHAATFFASTESWEVVEALRPEESFAAERERRAQLLALARPGAQEGLGPELVLAADQFIIKPAGRVEDSVRARASGDEVRTVIAGYHWFTDWGRDTMISLEGLALTTGRHNEARYILRTFIHYIRDGLIPNMFPEGEKEGLYHTADATLWFFHAIDRYVEMTGDRVTLKLALPKLLDIFDRHINGTRYGIRVDPADGLLAQGADGYQLTWMDAKVEGWVVTPRRGKAVEINALWYNALRLLEGWLREEESGEAARLVAEAAERARDSFNRRFWNEAEGYLFDVVDGEQGDDPSCRPNQILAISLGHPVLDESRWGAVLDVVRQRLLTPVGLRSLAPGHPEYRQRYDGDLRSRDAAYHQGTVWGWLIGPFVDAWLKVHPEDLAGARGFVEGFGAHLSEACIGSISEIFDAEPPFTPRGCLAQAWSVAEALRCWAKTGEVRSSEL